VLAEISRPLFQNRPSGNGSVNFALTKLHQD